MIHTSIILEITAFGYNIKIFHIIWGYFKAIDPIWSNFYGFNILFGMNFDQYNWHEYQSNTVAILVIKLNCIILIEKKRQMILVLRCRYYFLYIFILSKKNSCLRMKISSTSYYHDFRLNCNSPCTHVNYTMDYYCCMMYDLKLNEIKKIKNINNVDDTIDEMSKVSINDCHFIIANINCVIIYKCCIVINICVCVQSSDIVSQDN